MGFCRGLTPQAILVTPGSWSLEGQLWWGGIWERPWSQGHGLQGAEGWERPGQRAADVNNTALC